MQGSVSSYELLQLAAQWHKTNIIFMILLNWNSN